jgi:uncharacterized membrane protein YvbJ
MTETVLNNETNKECPYCAELIKNEAKVCKHCGYNLETGNPSNVANTATPITQLATPQPKAGSTVGDGVKLGCGMFIVLPIIIIVAIIIFVAVIGAS